MAIIDEVLVDIPHGQARVTTISQDPKRVASDIRFQFLISSPDVDHERLLKEQDWFRESFRDALLVKAHEGSAAARLALGYRRDEDPQESASEKPQLLH